MSLQGAALPSSPLVPPQDASCQQYTFLKALQPQNTKLPSVGLPPSQAFTPLLAHNCFKRVSNPPKLQRTPWRQPGLLMEQGWKQSALLRPHKENAGLLVKKPRVWARSAWFHQGTRGSLGGLSRKLCNALSSGCNTEDEPRKSCGAFCSHSHRHQQPSQPKDSLISQVPSSPSLGAHGRGQSHPAHCTKALWAVRGKNLATQSLLTLQEQSKTEHKPNFNSVRIASGQHPLL